jgi:hypothetical protein
MQYTLPVEPQSLDPNGLAVLQNSGTNGATVSSVNIMVFDYYQSGEGTVNMGNAAVSAGGIRIPDTQFEDWLQVLPLLLADPLYVQLDVIMCTYETANHD